jgi:hypothetical protein
MASLASYAGIVADQADAQARGIRALKQPGRTKEKRSAVAFEDALGGLATRARELKTAATSDKIGVVSTSAKAAADAGRKASDATTGLPFAECGNGERDAAVHLESGATAAAKQSFISKANAICKRVNNVSGGLPANPTLRQIADVLAGVLPAVDQAVADLRALEKPAADAATLDEFVALEAKQTEAARQLEAAARRGDGAATAAFGQQVDTLGNEVNVKADAYGMKECGSGSA